MKDLRGKQKKCNIKYLSAESIPCMFILLYIPNVSYTSMEKLEDLDLISG